VRGYEAYLEWSAPFQTAFPDISRVVEDFFGEGDKMAVRFTFSGTHTGEFSGVAPTGNRMTFTGIAIYRISEGKIAEQWVEFDVGSLMKQINVTTD
jgi:predicted ester cyclase